jgi:hypothetical protein
VWEPEGKTPLGRSVRRWEDNVKIDRKAVSWEGLEWICMAQDRDRRCGNEPSGSIKCGELLNCGPRSWLVSVHWRAVITCSVTRQETRAALLSTCCVLVDRQTVAEVAVSEPTSSRSIPFSAAWHLPTVEVWLLEPFVFPRFESAWWCYMWFLKWVEYVWLDLNSCNVDWGHLDPFVYAGLCCEDSRVIC